MRVSTQQLYLEGVDRILEGQRTLARLQAQLGSGKRLLSPADDPASAARVLEIDRLQALTRQFRTNAALATERLELEDRTLEAAVTSLQRVRELALRGRSAQLTHDDRRFLAAEVRERLRELLALANTVDGNGDYLFAGHQAKTLPFVQDPSGAVAYQGDQGSRLVEVSAGYALADADPGHAVFMAIRNGNGTYATYADSANNGTGILTPGGVTNPAAYLPHDYRIVFTSPSTFDVVDDTAATTIASAVPYVSGAAISAIPGISLSLSGAPAAGDEFFVLPSAHQPVFSTVLRLAEALETPLASAANGALFADAINRVLADLDQAAERFLEVRASVGARLKAIEAQKAIGEDLEVQLATLRSRLEDVDLARAASELTLQLTTLQAAEQAFARVQGLSLFDFL